METQQLYIEDVRSGTPIPPLTRTHTAVSVFLVGVAYWTAHRIHYDKEWARSEGYDDVLVTAPLLLSLVTRMLNRWTGHPFAIRKLASTSRAYVYPGQKLTARGVVREVAPETGLVECDVYIERDDGTQPVVGSAVVHLPAREGS